MNKPQNQGEMVSAAQTQISPVYSRAIVQTANHYQTMVAFVAAQMKKGVDYGVIPGTKKPTLLKPGAENLCRLFSLRPSYELIYRCTLVRQGEMVGQGDGSCNSKEKKYEKQQYKIFDLTNTVCKIAQKRALVAAVLSSCGASEFFTQDIEEMGGVNR